MSSSDEDDSYGPPLPPGFKSKHNHKREDPGTSSEEEEDNYGPSLPPHLLQSFRQKHINTSNDDVRVSSVPSNLMKNKMREKEDSNSDSNESDSYVPALPPHLCKNTDKLKKETNSDEDAYVPALPPSMQKYGLKRKEETDAHQNKYMKKDTKKEESEEDEDMYLPALPPHLMKNNDDDDESSLPPSVGRKIQGPILPTGYIPPESLLPYMNTEEEEGECSESDDEDEGLAIGPAPSALPVSEKDYRIQQLELRAKKMKDKLEGKFDESKPVKRETWMLELPEDKPNFCGLAPRQFRRKAPQPKGDRSVWTDTPADRERKAQMDDNEEEHEEKDLESIINQQRDEYLTAKVDKYNEEKRAKPLIDLHKKKLKEKEEKSGPKERRPFSREDDMNVNKFDEAQKTNILKKARELNDRFSAGGKKFL